MGHAEVNVLEKIKSAILSADSKSLQDVFEKHEDFDLTTTGNGHHLLHMAVGHVQIILTLLEHGLNIDEKENGFSPLHLAAKDDFLETTMYLLIYKADINLQSDSEKTALELARENSSRSVQTFLLFAGAELTKGLLDQDDESKHNCVLKGIEDKKVSVGAEVFKPQGGSSYKSLIPIAGQKPSIEIGGVEQKFVVFIREMEPEYQDSSIEIASIEVPDGSHYASKIYQYKVDRSVKCNIKVPLIGSSDGGSRNYLEYFVVQSTDVGNMQQDNVNIVGKEVVITGMTLHAHGKTSIVTFGVLARAKEDTYTIAAGPSKQRIQSKVLDLFAVDVSNSRASRDTKLTLKVEKAVLPKVSESAGTTVNGSDEYTNDSDGVSDCSDFCSFTTSNESLASDSCEDDDGSVNVQLPAPIIPTGSDAAVLRCTRGDNPNSASSWNVVATERRPGNANAVNVRNGLEGWYIVVIIKKLTGLVRQTVRDMYCYCVGDRKRCVMYTMVKQNTPQWDIIVVLCLYKDRDTSKRNMETRFSGFRLSEYGFTNPEDMNTKKTFMLVLKSYQGCEVAGPQKLPIKYQQEADKYQIFKVKVDSDDSPVANVYCVKQENAKKDVDVETKSKFNQPIDFTPDSARVVIPPNRFLSDAFLEKIADQIEDKWFELGLNFQIPICTLLGFEQVEGRNKKVLLKWRNDNTKVIGQCLDRAMIACSEVCLPDVRQSLLGEVLRWVDQDDNVKRWAEKYKIKRISENDITSDLKQLDKIPVCPFSDAFLYCLHKHLPIDTTLFIQLELKQSDLDETPGSWPLAARRCHLLHKVRNICGGKRKTSVFLKKIVNELRTRNDNLFVLELEHRIRLWFRSGSPITRSSWSDREVAELKNIFKIKNLSSTNT